VQYSHNDPAQAAKLMTASLANIDGDGAQHVHKSSC
jgi:hypothetical protein